MILRLLRFTADLSNEPKGNYTCLFTVDKKILSILSRIPPWPGIILEKSFMEYFLLINEKNKSPKNKEEAIRKHSKKLNLKK